MTRGFPDTESSMGGNAAGNLGLVRTSRRALLGAAGAGALSRVTGAHQVGAAATPSGVTRARRQAGSDVVTFPRPGSRTASPGTEITFRGTTREALGAVSVVASQSGAHSGLIEPHADGNGVSFVPDSPFDPGERVAVAAGAAGEISFEFEVARPARQRDAPFDLVTDAPRVPPRQLASRPDLRPPAMEVTVPATGTAEGLIFLGARVSRGQAGAMILDDAGELVWFAPPDHPLNAPYDVRVQDYQGEPVITFAEANAEGPEGWRRGHYAICNQAYERIVEFGIGNGLQGGDHHEFRLTAEGTALVGSYHPIQWDLSPFGGPAVGIVVDYVIQELEIETGRVLFEWHCLDHIAIDESYGGVPKRGDRQYDYLHINSIAVAPDGDLVISSRHSFAVYKLDGVTGDVVWRLNGKRSDFAMGDGCAFAYTHDAQLHENGVLTLFDNATSGPSADVQSRGLVLQLDEEAMTATLVQEYLHPTEVISVSQGNVQMLPNGNVFVGWGSAPVLSEFTAEGELIFNCRFPRGGSSYRAYRFPWVGQPAEPPAVAAARAADGSITVYASWNGATEVASWRALAGPSADQLAEAGSVERAGFETAIALATDAAWVAVEALDAGGTVLGRSGALEVPAT